MTDEPTIREKLFKHSYPMLYLYWIKEPYSFLRLHKYDKKENYSQSEVTRILEKKRS